MRPIKISIIKTIINNISIIKSYKKHKDTNDTQSKVDTVYEKQTLYMKSKHNIWKANIIYENVCAVLLPFLGSFSTGTVVS